MDPKLAEIYGTNQTTEADIEKLAAAELATNLAGGEEPPVNTDEMTEEDLEAIAQQVLAPEEEQPEVTEPEMGEQAEQEAKEKVSEADYLGRVMAHAYVHELKEIEKTAGRGDGQGQEAEKATEDLAKKNAKRAKYDKMGAEGPSRGAKIENKARDIKAGAGKVAKYVGEGFKGGKQGIGRRAAAAGTVATGAALTGLAAKKIFGKGKEKKSEAEVEPEQQMSAVDTLVQARALEILEASGIDPKSLAPVEQEKTSADETVDPREILAATVEQRAWELLGQYGVEPVEQETEQEQQ